MHGLVRGLQAQPVGSKQRTMALLRLKQKAFGAPKPLPVIRTGPPKGIAAPAPTSTPTPVPTASPAPTAAPVETPTATPTPIATVDVAVTPSAE